MTPLVTMVIGFTSGPDGAGRRSFTVRWADPTTGRNRAQCFHARPMDIVRSLRRDGHRVVTERRFATLALKGMVEALGGDGRREGAAS